MAGGSTSVVSKTRPDRVIIEHIIDRDMMQKRAEALVRKWLADCRPMTDAVDLQVLEDRIAAELRAVSSLPEKKP